MAKNLILWLVIAVVLMTVFQSFGTSETGGSRTDYTEFMSQVSNKQVKEARISGREIKYKMADDSPRTTYMPTEDPLLLSLLLKNNVKTVGEPPEQQGFLQQVFIYGSQCCCLSASGYSLCAKCRAAAVKAPCRSVKARRAC